jgi:hypothetical protein
LEFLPKAAVDLNLDVVDSGVFEGDPRLSHLSKPVFEKL